MKKSQKNKHPIDLKFYSSIVVKAIAVTIVIAAMVVGWIMYNTRTFPLGDRMEYIGKIEGGGWIPPSSSYPHTTYYYGTDLSAMELVDYFGKAKLVSEVKDDSYQYEFVLDTPDGSVAITAHKHRAVPSSGYANFQFSKTDRRYLIEIQDYDYELLRQSLR